MDIQELQQKTWQEIKAIAESLAYKKPSKLQWLDEEVLEAIVAKSGEKAPSVEESIEAKTVGEAEQKPSLDVSKQTPKTKGKYATEYFKKNKIPYCTLCGAQHQHTPDGIPVCPESRKDCPRSKTQNS